MKCCQSAPRCVDCPVLVAARSRRRFARKADGDAIVAEILAGVSPRVLPVCVRDALALLDEQRSDRITLPR